MIPNLPANIPIVDAGGNMTEQFRLFLNQITGQQLFVGTGSPEGVVAAQYGARYMDDSATTGSILYIKKFSDISGDCTQGWVLV